VNKKIIRMCLAVLFGASPLSAAIKTQVVDYREGGQTLQGFLAYDAALSGKVPGVLVAHEWKGHGDYVRRRTEQLAREGYVAFALDMYGKGVYAKNHEEAAQLSGVYFGNRDRMRKRALAGLSILQKNPHVDTTRLAAVGYCFGGTTVLELARAGTDLRGVASFHGNLTTPVPAAPGAIKAKVLVLQGGNDDWTASGLPDFESEMKKAGADWQINIYGGAVHSFTVVEAGVDASTGMAYNAAADQRSWNALMDFFAEIFK
jgi:dienelactone hydrolase